MKKIILVIFFSIVFIGCAANQPRLVQTKSGMPEISIHSKDVEIVKSAIIDEIFATGKGYIILSETNNRIVFSREPKGFGANLAQALMVGAAGEAPKVEVSFTISKRQNKITVYAQLAQVYKDRFGKVTRNEATHVNKNFNDLYQFLTQVKSNLE